MGVACVSGVLFAIFLAFVVAVIVFGAYSAGALLGNRPRTHVPEIHVQYLVPSPPNPPLAPHRVARGTTPPPIPVARAAEPSLDEVTNPDLSLQLRFARPSSRRL